MLAHINLEWENASKFYKDGPEGSIFWVNGRYI
jgi:hypothetical protein